MDYCWQTPERQITNHEADKFPAASDAVIAGWARALDMRAQFPEGFSQRAATMASRLALDLGLDDDEIALLVKGALLHDIGMMNVPDSVLRKPGALTPAERALVRLHPVYAEDILAPIAAMRPALAIPRYHHERWDGAGYPHGFRGGQIPLHARIFAVAGTWEALGVDRPYRRALPPEHALAVIQEGAGTMFDPQIVATFLTMVDHRARD